MSFVTKVFYFSDGSGAQYKNFKNFANLTFHKQDFGIEAEWHFFATSHGKNACDGVGGTLKRLAAKASSSKADEGSNINTNTVLQICINIRDRYQEFLCPN